MKDITPRDTLDFISLITPEGEFRKLDQKIIMRKAGIGYFMKYRKVGSNMLVISIVFDANNTLSKSKEYIKMGDFDADALFDRLIRHAV